SGDVSAKAPTFSPSLPGSVVDSSNGFGPVTLSAVSRTCFEVGAIGAARPTPGISAVAMSPAFSGNPIDVAAPRAISRVSPPRPAEGVGGLLAPAAAAPAGNLADRPESPGGRLSAGAANNAAALRFLIRRLFVRRQKVALIRLGQQLFAVEIGHLQPELLLDL